MGDGSRNFAWYYLVCALLYLAISISAFAQIDTHRGECESKCPLLIRDSSERNYSQCACFAPSEGDVASNPFAAYGFRTREEFEDWKEAASNSPARFELLSEQRYNAVAQKPCFICNSDEPESTTVYTRCESYDKCSTPGVLGFSVADSISGACQVLTSPNVTLRSTVISTLTAFAVFYLLMSLSAGLVSAGYFVFADKWADDFGRLTRFEKVMAFCAKNAPVLVRICNFLVVFFLAYSIVLVYAYDVCSTDVDSNGKESFFEFAQRITLAVVVVWILGCVVGTLFNCFMPKDTPFYAPKTPTTQRDGQCMRCCASCAHLLLRTGP